jgi:glycosyltransferase involved in cell wall biosynthesis
MSKPRVYIAPLCGPENWIFPYLHSALMLMQSDKRFDVVPGMVYGVRGYDIARNAAIEQAKKERADWILMADHDVVPRFNPLDVLAMAGDRAVIGWSYALGSGQGDYQIFPPGERSGEFTEVGAVGGGLLAIHSSVWKRIKAPLFRTLSDGINYTGEDMYFCRLARENGFRIWTPKQLLGHMHTTDVTPNEARR